MLALDRLRSLAPRIRGVAFDVDDTVTRGGRLEPEAFAAMWALRDAGVALIAATGRPLGWADVIARQWPVVAAVGENGAGWSWVDARGDFSSAHHDPADTRRASRRRLDEVRAAVLARFPDVAVANDQGARRCDLAFDVGETRTLATARRAELAAFVRHLGLRVTESSVHLHAIPGDWDKRSGIAGALRDAAGVDLDAVREAWLYVGDSPNDGPAFGAFPGSVGVANVADHPRDAFTAPPTYVTRADRGRGFAEVAALLLDARGPA